MLKRTERVLQLISELDGVCATEGIPYSLGGLAPRGVKEHFVREMPRAELFVRAEDLPRLVGALNASSRNRELEFIGTNPDYPFFSVRYVDPSTTFIDCRVFNECSCWGLYVEIWPLVGSSILACDYYEQGEDVVADATNTHWLQYGDRAVRGSDFSGLCHDYACGEDEEWYCSNVNRFLVPFDPSYLSENHRVPYGGFELLVPDDLDGYFETIYKFKKGKRFPTYPNSDNLISTDVPYRQVAALVQDAGDTAADISTLMGDVARINAEVKENNARIDTVWAEMKKVCATG